MTVGRIGRPSQVYRDCVAIPTVNGHFLLLCPDLRLDTERAGNPSGASTEREELLKRTSAAHPHRGADPAIHGQRRSQPALGRDAAGRVVARTRVVDVSIGSAVGVLGFAQPPPLATRHASDHVEWKAVRLDAGGCDYANVRLPSRRRRDP